VKKMNILFTALLMTLAFNAQASMAPIKTIVLNDNSIIESSSISAVHIFPYINTVDYIDLKEGSRIESSDIKKVIFQDFFSTASSRFGTKDQMNSARVGGDGSGG